MSLHRSVRLSFCAVFVLVAVLTTNAFLQAQETESWNCLPEQTAFAVRIPNGQAFAAQFVENTKLGKVMFSEKRKAAIMKALEEVDQSEWEEFQEGLEEYGLSNEDFLEVLAGESGYAVVVEEGDEGKLLPLGLAWLEPGEDLAGRLKQALARGIEDNEDDEYPVIRLDMELAGQGVVQLMIPKINVERDDFEYPEGYEDMSADEREQAWDEAYKKWNESAEKSVSYFTALLTSFEGRLLAAHSFEVSDSKDSHPDTEALSALMSQFLEAHSSSAGGFVEKYSDNPLTAEVMGVEGDACLELVADGQRLWELLKASAATDEKAEIAARIVGFDSMSFLALKSALDGNQWKTQAGLAVSQPREGLMKLIEQEAIDLTPPAWVPATAMRYGQFSFDLASAYTLIKDLVSQEFPEQANVFGIADMQVFGFAQANVEDILKSVGTRHVMATFEDDSSVVELGVGKQTPDATAVVWKLSDEQIWSRILKAVTPMVTSIPGAEVSDEQGYNGIRISNEAAKMGIFLGNGNLVLAIGSGVLEKTLSSLNNPPAGDDSFRGSEVYQRAAELLDVSSGIACDIVDGNRYAVVMRKWILSMFDQIELARGALQQDDDSNGEEKKVLEFVKSLMPDEDEVENVLGVGATRYDVSDDGVLMKSVLELPPPEDE